MTKNNGSFYGFNGNLFALIVTFRCTVYLPTVQQRGCMAYNILKVHCGGFQSYDLVLFVAYPHIKIRSSIE